jgi:uncharacterized protein YerC
LKNLEEVHLFLSAMLSEEENKRLRKRWHAYQLRARGMSLATIVRVARIAMTTATRAAALHQNSQHKQILDTTITRATHES